MRKSGSLLGKYVTRMNDVRRMNRTMSDEKIARIKINLFLVNYHYDNKDVTTNKNQD